MSVFKDNIGYRTESYSGSYIRDVLKIMYYEILELGNTDILDTLLNKTDLIQEEELRKAMEKASNYIDENGAPGWDSDDSELESSSPSDTQDQDEKNIDYDDHGDEEESYFKELYHLIPRILTEVRKQSHHPIQYALWLADYDKVSESQENGGYSINDNEEIDKYIIGPVILSDLGEDGVLFGYDEQPQPLQD